MKFREAPCLRSAISGGRGQLSTLICLTTVGVVNLTPERRNTQMQIEAGCCCMVWSSGSFHVACHPNTYVLARRPTNFLRALQHSGFIFVCSSSAPCPPQWSQLSESRNSSAAVGAGPCAEAEASPLAQPIGSARSRDSWSVLLHVLPASSVPGLPGELRFPAATGSPSSRHSSPPWHVFSTARLQLRALKAARCHLFSQQLPAAPEGDGQTSAGSDQEVKLPPAASEGLS